MEHFTEYQKMNLKRRKLIEKNTSAKYQISLQLMGSSLNYMWYDNNSQIKTIIFNISLSNLKRSHRNTLS